jgi:hypothetical protein
MKSWMTAVSMILVASVATAQPAPQTQKSSGTPVMNEITVKIDDAVYTGTMELTTDREKVTGKMHITVPTEITGTVAGTSAKGAMTLDFPFYMVENKCEGKVKMEATLPPKPGPTAGTLEVIGCDRDAPKLTGTFELKPVASKEKPVKN